ncbi:MAG: ribonuclease J [Clostridia bacterium]|nr:ribonuclease J [Clostridia bacterium]
MKEKEKAQTMPKNKKAEASSSSKAVKKEKAAKVKPEKVKAEKAVVKEKQKAPKKKSADKAPVVKASSNSKIKIIPLGGLDEIGKNMTAFEFEDEIMVVDCGVAFPEDDMLGVDLVIPDITYLSKNLEKVKGFVFTHGHEDHIGAVPYVIQDINVPIYATKLTMGLINNKLVEFGLDKKVSKHVVNPGDSVHLGKNFKVEFIRTNHSIADSVALAIHTPAGVIVHTGDFKVDYTPVGDNEPINLAKFAELGSKGVLALMADSTNVERKGFTMSEKTVGETFDNIFAQGRKSRIIITTFASNVHRVQQIVNCAEKYKRKIAIQGRSMVNVIETASELGYLNMPDNMVIDISEVKNYSDHEVVILVTGSQGQPMSALSRMAHGENKQVEVKAGDIVVFSSTPVPGNERTITKLINELYKKGVEVIKDDTHVSGHACQEELKLIYTLLKPKYMIPVHGEYRHQKIHAELVKSLGHDSRNTFIMEIGEVLELNEESAKVTGVVPSGQVFIDGLGVGDVGNIVLRDRKHLSQDGLIVVVLAVDKAGQVVSGPDIISRGFVYVRESENLMVELKDLITETVMRWAASDNSEWHYIKNTLKDDIKDFVWEKTRRNPMILPIIMEV